jgi:hypothetical protein
MSVQITVEELKTIIRDIVREELDRRQQVDADITTTQQVDTLSIDELADQVFERYDDVFKALA